MKKTFNILTIVLLVAILFSCEKKDKFLNKEPLGDYSETSVWSDPPLIETFVNSMYRNALGLPFSYLTISDAVDESHEVWDFGLWSFTKSLMTSDGLYGWNGWGNDDLHHYNWQLLYANIRRTNIFFSKINSVKSDDQAWVTRLKGETYFLRAWTYHFLVAMYGGVPIITKTYILSDEFKVPRNTYEECINFIVGQLDSAAMYLPEDYPDANNNGRATRGAALAFKSRVLLYAASDLHNPAKNSVVTSGFSNPELLGYTGGDAYARWTAAKNAAKAVIDLGKYDLYMKNPSPTDSVAQNFVNFFISKGTQEDILLQYFTSKTDEGVNPSDPGGDAYNPGLYYGPNGYHNWGGNAPLGDMVDDYEMKDGSTFDWNNPVHKANLYLNREARFYASILYEGAQWRVRPDDALKIDPVSKIQVGHVYNTSGVMVKAGLDSKEGPIEDFNGCYTGYYQRKYIDPSVEPQYTKQDVPFKHLRYAEVLLNYAEACIELGEDVEARTYINMIRTRAGQPDLPALTGDALLQACRHERRIELAFEGHRFWDVRRWLIAPEAYHQTSGIDIRYVTSETVTGYRKADGSTWGAPIFAKKDVPGDARAWDNKCYFFPILRDEMNKNDMLVQNPGY